MQSLSQIGGDGFMKVLGINGSARKDGNTAIMIKKIFEILEEGGVETEMVQLAGEQISGCRDCGLCKVRRNGKCALENDPVNDIVQKMVESDGIILGSPVYFSNITPEMKALIDRAGRVVKVNDYLLKNKVGASVVAVRRAGALPAFHAMNCFFFVEQMIVPGSIYWNLAVGRDIGDVESDDEGMETMTNLGVNILYLLKKLSS
jgi:multimeric flavodoxin WrbA